MTTGTGDTGRVSQNDLSRQDWFKSEALQRVLTLINDDDGEARIVGGAVRNALMGLGVHDIDIATTLRPEEVSARAKAAGIKVVPTGVDHGTVTLVVEKQPFEVTTLRADVKTDGRRAQVAFGTDWAVDAARRDFTVNALYADRHGRVIDLVDGLADIEAGHIRFIGHAEQRIEEDYLRILRFFRFFAWYGKGRPDAEGLKAAARLKTGLDGLSAERVWSELRKLLGAPDPSRALLWMRQSGVLTQVLPETEKWGIDAIPALIHAEEALGWHADPMLRLMAMIPPEPERVTGLAKRLKMSKAEATRLRQWAEAPKVSHDIGDKAFARVLYENDAAAVGDRLALSLSSARARARSDTNALAEAGGYVRLRERAASWKRPVFPVTGEDLMKAGHAQGPAMGRLLKLMEKHWIDSNFTLSKDALLAKSATKSEETESEEGAT